MSFFDDLARWKIHVLMGYIVLTLLLTYPSALDIGHAIIGDPDGEAGYWIGTFSWCEKALFSPGVNPLHNSDIFYPFGSDINDGGLPAILLSPLTHLIGAITTYNLYVLSTFILAGFGAYLLTYHLTRNGYAAFLAGLIFAFSPTHFAHINGGILHAASIQWLPFYILFLMRAVEGNRRLDMALCALFFALNAASSWTSGVTATLFSLLYLGLILYHARKTGEAANVIKKLAVTGFLAFLLVSPFVIVLVMNMATNTAMVKPLNEKIFFSADLLGFVTPSKSNPVLGPLFSGMSDQFTGVSYENTVYIGLVVLFFAALAWRGKSRYVPLFTAAAVVFFVMALGPYLQVGGTFTFFGQVRIPLPAIVYDELPILSMLRYPDRMALTLMLMMAVLAGFGMARAFDGLKKRETKLLLFGLLASLVVLEFAFALPVAPVDIPAYYSTIAADRSDYVLMDLPFAYSPGASTANTELPVYMLYQDLHGKKIAGGPLSREGLIFKENVIGSPLQSLWYLKPRSDIIDTGPAAVRSALKYNDIRYVILHKDLTRDSYLQQAVQALPGIIGSPPGYEDERLVVYEIGADTPQTPYVVLHDGWYVIENWTGTSTRWMSNNATLTVISTASENVTLTFRAIPFDGPRELDVFVNGVLADRRTLSGLSNVSVNIRLINGKSDITFFAPGGTDPASDVYTGDPRDISIAFQCIRADDIARA